MLFINKEEKTLDKQNMDKKLVKPKASWNHKWKEKHKTRVYPI